jgi:hypothetical protein
MTDLIVELRDAANEYREVRERVSSVGEGEQEQLGNPEQDLEAVSEAYQEVITLLDRYEERATDWDDFEGYIEFQSELVDLIDGFPSDLLAREAFESVDERLHQRTLSESDFKRARSDDLQPAAEYAALYDRLNEVRERYRDDRYAVSRRRDELDDRITDLERLKRFEKTDLDAPVQRVREPIETYNETVREDFRTFVQEESARTVLSLVETIDVYPLVEYRQPPPALREYVETHPAGTESIPDLLAYAEYSRSKLDHYVENAQALKAAVDSNRTYLARLDGGPLELAWPPPSPTLLRFQIRERIAVVGRFAPDETVVQLRELRALSKDPVYDRLRESALARNELDDEARERLQDGSVDRDLERARAKREQLNEVLSEFPSPDW